LEYQVVIPARAGSKRLPRKNLINFCGKPLISHTIEFAIKSFPRDKIWVNTDDQEIKIIAQKYGVQITTRPISLGTDTASTADVLSFQCNHFLNSSILCDAIILLQATNPLRPTKMIEESITAFEISKRGSLASFSKLNKKYGEIKNNIFKPKNYQPGQRMQEIIPDFFENGLIYITKIEELIKGKIITDNVFPFVYNGIESIVDIDLEEDLLIAEYIYHRINKI
jgi:CMP-N-acetylneuraminic acid synthetase